MEQLGEDGADVQVAAGEAAAGELVDGQLVDGHVTGQRPDAAGGAGAGNGSPACPGAAVAGSVVGAA